MQRRFSVIRDGCGTSAALIAALMAVLHLVLAVPAELRAADLGVPLCAAPAPRSNADGPVIPPPHHHHGHCLLCHAPTVPILPSAPAPAPAGGFAVLGRIPVADDPVSAPPRFGAYAARAPPAAV